MEPTVTDANVVLGYIPVGKLATGDVDVNFDAAWQSIASRIAQPLQLDVLDAALGIHRIANAHILRALREVSVRAAVIRAFYTYCIWRLWTNSCLQDLRASLLFVK